MKVVSLFSGAGGLDLGFTMAGHSIIWANDLYGDAVETYENDVGRLNDALRDRDILEYALSEGEMYSDKEVFFECCGGAKWYDHEEDILAISKMFPNATFLLHGEGEESTDIWDEYFKNGQSETCAYEIVVPQPRKIKWKNI